MQNQFMTINYLHLQLVILVDYDLHSGVDRMVFNLCKRQYSYKVKAM